MAVSPLCRQHGRSLEKEGTPMWLCKSPGAGGSGLRRMEVGNIAEKPWRLGVFDAFADDFWNCNERMRRPQFSPTTRCIQYGGAANWHSRTHDMPVYTPIARGGPSHRVPPTQEAPSQTFSHPLLLSSPPSSRPSIQRSCSHII